MAVKTYPVDPRLAERLANLKDLPEWGALLEWLLLRESQLVNLIRVHQFETVDKIGLMAASLKEALRLIQQLRALPGISQAIVEDIRKKEGSTPLDNSK